MTGRKTVRERHTHTNKNGDKRQRETRKRREKEFNRLTDAYERNIPIWQQTAARATKARLIFFLLPA